VLVAEAMAAAVEAVWAGMTGVMEVDFDS